MKYVATIVVTALGVILLIQNGTTAGPSPSPRSVPIIVQDVMQPSRMVTESISAPDAGTFSSSMVIPEGQVLVLTSASFNLNYLVEIRVANVTVDRVEFSANANGTSDQRLYPTGIRVPRGQDGTADLEFITSVAGGQIFVHGYLADDF